MKHLHITFLLFVLISMISGKVEAHDIEVKNADGVTIYYNWIDNGTALSVCYHKGSRSAPNDPNLFYNGKIVIPESVSYNGKSYLVKSIGDRAFSIGYDYTYYTGAKGLTSIEIPNSVTSIGDFAFGACRNLTSISLPNSVTTIGEGAFYNCTGLTSITIPNSVTSIGKDAFSNTAWYNKQPDGLVYAGNVAYKYKGTMPSNTNITIKEGTTAIAQYAFCGCEGLTSITIPNSITSIGNEAFYGSTNINAVNRIIDIATWCKADPITYENNRSNPMYYAEEIHLYKDNGTEITDFVIPDEVTSIRSSAFSKCVSLKSVTIPNSVTSIGASAFYGCFRLTTVTVGNSVKSIGSDAFEKCTKLNAVNRIIDIATWCTADPITYGNSYSNPMYYAKELHLYKDNGTEITDLVIPNEVTSIRSSAFSKCISIKSVTIPNSVESIGSSAFIECTGLSNIRFMDGDNALKFSDANNSKTFANCPITTLYLGRNLSYQYSPFQSLNTLKDVTIGNNVTSIGNSTFYGCTGLTSIAIPNSVTSIGSDAFWGCTGLTSIDIPNSVTSIGDYAFSCCTGLTSIAIPNSVTSIGSGAFNYCTGLTSISLSDNITSIGYNVFDGNTKLFVARGTKTLITIWNNYRQVYTPYDKKTNTVLLAPGLAIENVTQTKATVKLLNVDFNDGYTYTYNGEVAKDTIYKYDCLRPETTQQLKLVVSRDDVHYDVTGSFTTKSMNAIVDDKYEVTASSIRATGSYTEEDAKVVAQRMYILGKPTEGNECFASGLNPGRSYTIVNEIDVDYGGETTATYRASRNISPARLQFKTAAPKVVSMGNAIVSATVNLDPDEENVGFEWRRTDWTNDFPSNTGQAYLYEGVIEGYIKNLNTDKLWKFRPYYLSDDGTYHYGDWMGLDPTNTSYFEPTVHTYARINIEGNTALVRGYALAGTENIKVQGFKYWKTSQGSNASHQAPSIPANAKTIVATGQQIITATLAALDYNSTYHYVAFVTTEDGTTYYGEEHVFSTPTAPAGIDDVIANSPANMKKGVYTLTGVKLADELSELQGLPQGVYIIDGKKVMVK